MICITSRELDAEFDFKIMFLTVFKGFINKTRIDEENHMGYEEEREIGQEHRRNRRAKPSEMEDDGLTLITDSFTERREDGSHRAEIEAEVVRKRQRGDRRSLAAAGRAGIRRKPGP